MAVITWPAALKPPAEFSVSQARYDIVESSDATGSQSARLFGPPRWRISLRSIDAYSLRDAGVYEAMLLQLRGGINHLALHDPVRAQPQGTLRGSPALHATAAAGATSLQLGGCRSLQNLLLTPSLDVDTNADGMADNWTVFDLGSAGTVTVGAGIPNGSPRAQRISATALNTTPASQAGVQQRVPGILPGQTLTFSVDELCATACQVELFLQWLDAGQSYISQQSASFTGSTSAYTRRSLTATAVANTAFVNVIVLISSNPSLGFAALDVDNAQLELGSTASALAPAPALLAGDWLQLGTGLGTSQLVKVVADAAASNNSLMTVQVEPPLRQQFTAATAVAWDRPVAYYKQLGTPQWSYRPGLVAKQAGFALDLLEAFA